jgi:penicillin-binding protein-related factor A (putative recombinase)
MLEKNIENQILIYLRTRGVLAWKTKTVGTYDVKLGRFRKSSPLYRKGVSDIIGIYNGLPIAIEVKSAKGRLSPEQELFISDFVKHGGRALIARSLEHVIKFLEIMDNERK